MKRNPAAVLMAVALAASISGLTLGQASGKQSRLKKQQGAASSDEKLGQELVGLYKTWREARKRGDTETMSRIMGDEWTITNSTGHIVTRARSLEAAQAGNWKDDILPTLDNITARVYGNVALVTFHSKGQTGLNRNLHLFVKRQGRWQWVAGQQTKLAEQPPQ